MLFHTWTFAVFFLIFYPIYLALRKTCAGTPWLLAASYVFYAGWSPIYLLLILWSTTVDYLAVTAMARTGRRRTCLAVSIANNLLLLGLFKYGRFVVENLNAVLAHLGVSLAVSLPDVSFVSDALNALLAHLGVPYSVEPFGFLLPVGISFYVFQSMSYTIDFYRGNVEREPSFIRYATFVSLFPQLVAGPIERARNLLPQLRRPENLSGRDIADGLSLFVVGLFKKVALADYLAMYVDPIYNAPAKFQGPALALATFAFAWQIYFDFSGYTDMARGIGRMMGIRLMLNFNNPYLATGLGDFWRRWHISLSTWFRDYVYIPLGGSRRGEFLTRVNLCLTMVVSGLWHGAKWTFVCWGVLHAVGYVLTRSMERSAFYRERVPRAVKQLVTFGLVTLAWVFFRAESLGDAWLILGRIFAWLAAAGTTTSGWADPRCPWLMAALVFAVWLYQYVHESKLRSLLAPAPVRVGLVVLMVFYIALAGGAGDKPFIYFQF